MSSPIPEPSDTPDEPLWAAVGGDALVFFPATEAEAKDIADRHGLAISRVRLTGTARVKVTP
tara:strand:- start:20952 stop:21137 length:186 start_codon:yes stop_codon:yes gene_type:complete